MISTRSAVGRQQQPRQRERRQWISRDRVVAGGALAVGAVLAGHRLVPDLAGLGSLLDSFLPWLGLMIPLLAIGALACRARRGLIALLVPTLVWLAMFGPAYLPKTTSGYADLSIVTQNLNATGNPRPATTIDELAATDASLVALEELTGRTTPMAAATLGRTHPYSVAVGTVGLWSRYPIRETQPLDLGIGWYRALRATVATPTGDVTVYVVHLANAMIGATAQRDRDLTDLAGLVRHDASRRLIVVGDFNTAITDRRIRQLTSQLRDAQQRVGTGLGFTWPATFPLTTPDHVLYRGITATTARVVDTHGSDHRAELAELRL